MLKLVWLLKWSVPWTPVSISKHLVSKYSTHIWKGILHCYCGDVVSIHFKTLLVITIDRHSSSSVLQISHEYSYKNHVHCIVGMAWAIVYNIKYTGGIWGWYVVKNWHRNVKDDIWALGEGAGRDLGKLVKYCIQCWGHDNMDTLLTMRSQGSTPCKRCHISLAMDYIFLALTHYSV